MRAFVVVIVALVACGLCALAEDKEGECNVSRLDIVKDSAVYWDRNDNNLLERSEIETAWNELLTPFEKTLADLAADKQIGPFRVESVKTIIENCDADGDGAISFRDFEKSNETCLNNCHKLWTVKHYIIPRAQARIPPNSQAFYDARRKRISQKVDMLRKRG